MKTRQLPFSARISYCFAALILVLSIAHSQASLFAYDGFAILNNNGGGNTYYDLDTPTGNPDYVGTTFTVDFGQTLKLGAQMKSNPGGGNPSSWGAEWAKIYYKIDGGSFASLDLAATSGTPGTDWQVNWEEANAANMVNVANGLSVGTHTLVIYLQAHDNTQPADGYISNGGANFSATISVIPEPTNVAMGVFFGLVLIISVYRTARKNQSTPVVA